MSFNPFSALFAAVRDLTAQVIGLRDDVANVRGMIRVADRDELLIEHDAESNGNGRDQRRPVKTR